MANFTYDHVHLRSPDPDETARYYQRMFGAEVIRSVMTNGIERTDINLAPTGTFNAAGFVLRDTLSVASFGGLPSSWP